MSGPERSLFDVLCEVQQVVADLYRDAESLDDPWAVSKYERLFDELDQHIRVMEDAAERAEVASHE